ncbi:MAG: class I adenylate-forming enzyme family protein [Acidimicrobiales bacterium]
MPSPPSIAELNATLTAPGQMFEMDVADIAGVPTRVWKNAPASLRDVLALSRAHGDGAFLVYEDERITFEEHFQAAATLAQALVERYGVAKGDRVAIAMRNFPEWVIAFWAAAAAGAIIVPLNAWWTGPELTYGLEDSEAKVLFADEARVELLAPHLDDLHAQSLRSVIVARAQGPLASGQEDFTQVMSSLEPATELPSLGLGPEDDATIFYTSGTTGRPKGAVGTQRNICTNLMSLFFMATRGGLRAASAAEARGEAPSPPSKRQNSYLLSVPLFHATGCHSILVANTAAGGKLVMMHRFNPERALELIEREQVTTFGGVPAMVWQILDSPDFDKRDTSSVTGIGYGGAPAPSELVKRIKEHFPAGQPSNGYGLTETSSLTTMNSGDDYVAKPDSVGTPVPVCDLMIVDDRGQGVETGQVGELWIRGPNVVRGYWHKPEASAETFANGWLHTGDVARLDEQGYCYIVDRAKDMIIRGGENVYCVEVEGVLFEHPAVSDAAVIGIPDRVLGEQVGAVVQVKPGASVTEKELQTHVANTLAAFKVPVKIWFRPDPLPRNPAGKILKRELRQELIPQ